MKTRKFVLSEKEMPEHWYNITASMTNKPLPPLHPGTLQPIGPEALAPLFPMELIKQEVTSEKWVEIPDEVRDLYAIWRPTPLYRAYELEKVLDTPAKIYYKYEGITTETGAGQWGSALSFACQHFGIECEVYMVKVSYDSKPYRKLMMNTWGAKVHSSPTNHTQAGRSILDMDPNSPGSLGIAISEAIERAASDEHTKYALGSVLNHVLLHQTIVGQEAVKQMEMAGDMPDIVVAPFGGGSNFAGISFPFLRLNLEEGKHIRCIAAEPASCPKLTRGVFRYDFGDTVGMTPLLPMYTLGHNFVPAPIHAGGLRYHGAGVIVSQLLKDKLIEARSHDQLECFQAGVLFAKAEGIIPAPEASHAIATVIQEAIAAKISGESKTILFNLCGHGHFDMQSYEDYFANKLVKHEVTAEEIADSLSKLTTPEIA